MPEENANYIKEALPNVTDCTNMLSGCWSLTSIDTTGWNTSNVINMNGMFGGCDSLIMVDVSKFNTNKVTNMQAMFNNCNSLISLDISNWDTSKVTNMIGMFAGCNLLTTIKGTIDMKSCTICAYMFAESNNLTGVKIKNPPPGVTAASGIGGLAAGKYEIVS